MRSDRSAAPSSPRTVLGLLLVGLCACDPSSRAQPSAQVEPAPAPLASASVSARTTPPTAASAAFEVARDWTEPERSTTAPPELRAFFEAGPSFPPLGPPKPGDWLAEHPERGQTFERFVRSRPNLPTAERHTLYIVPLEAWGQDVGPSLRDIAAYVSMFFGLPVRVTQPDAKYLEGVRSRIHERTGKRQLLTRHILRRLAERVPEDAYAVMALTQVDLYPEPSWNFVFGEAELRKRVAVHSFARYSSAFFGTAEVSEAVLKRRILSVSAHEIGHMFGLEHCTAHRCVLNGSNSLDETDRGSMHLCPVCLRKLQHSTGMAPGPRYRALRIFYGDAGLHDEAAWIDRRLAETKAGG